MTSLAERVLSRDPAQRLRLRAWLFATFCYGLYAALAAVQVTLGLSPLVPTLWLFASVVLTSSLFYVAIRSGWNLRFKRDPALSLGQLAVGMVYFYWMYALSGLASGAVIIITASHIAYSMFGMTEQQVRRLVVVSLACLGLTIAACAWLAPQRFPWRVQIVTYLYACVVVPLIARLATQVTSLHERVRSQRSELKAALARVQELAIWDDLTRVHNRRHLLEQMQAEFRKRARRPAPLCLALLDIDFFKKVNDTHGHAAGDEVLRRFSAAARAVVRSTDLLGRWGGEEFMVMFPDTPCEQAELALQRLREHLARLELGDIAGDLAITFSAGLVGVVDGDTLEAAIERADQAMYRAKTGGRNRTERG
ncbi:MAG: GGDEF domain-containing protein [Rhizobacter sp.]|nr:GGDEF domain-containing protein [Rhizobacter sp.]